jgi:putative heme-binding domain-containing protein
MALRDHLKQEKILAAVKNLALKEQDFLALAEGTLSLSTPQVASFLAENVAVLHKDPSRFSAYVKHIARYGDTVAQGQVAAFGKEHGDNPGLQGEMLKAMYQGLQERGTGLNGPTLTWAEELVGKLIASETARAREQGLELAGLLRIPSAQGTALALFQDQTQAVSVRSQAALALGKINPQKAVPALGKILADGAQPLALREAAARALAEANIPEGRNELVKSLGFAGAKLQSAIAANLAGSKQGAEALLEAVAKGKASPRLLQEKAVEQLLQKAGIPNLNAKLGTLTKGLPSPDARLLELLKQRSAGFAKAKADASMGALVFQKNCAACHALNNQGGKIAPQLDGVGHRGAERLLEDILDPNRNVDQEFRATTLVLKDGKIFNGLFLRQEGEIYVLADALGKEQRYAKADVEERVVSPMSPMPANWGEQMTEVELYNLLAFLLEQRAQLKAQK